MRGELRAFRTLSGRLADGARGSNAREREHMRLLLRRALRSELTERQALCFTLYFGDRLTMQQIADTLGLTRSTVSKHIAKGIRRLRRVLQYTKI